MSCVFNFAPRVYVRLIVRAVDGGERSFFYAVGYRWLEEGSTVFLVYLPGGMIRAASLSCMIVFEIPIERRVFVS